MTFFQKHLEKNMRLEKFREKSNSSQIEQRKCANKFKQLEDQGRIHFFLEISKFFQKVMTFFEKMYPVFKKFFKNVLEKPKPF